jgi:hypothetical protein
MKPEVDAADRLETRAAGGIDEPREAGGTGAIPATVTLNRRVLWRLGVFGVVGVFSALGYWLAPRRGPPPPLVEARVPVNPPDGLAPEGAARPARPTSEDRAIAEAELAAEKLGRVEKIRRDYEEVRARAAADYAATDRDAAGGLQGFLRQLALLEREKRADLAAVLTPRELEDLERRETPAGQTVQRLLGPTTASEEQRRAVFQLQREFEDRFALTFEFTPAALLERETARQQLNEKVRAVIGDALFLTAWLSGEGPEDVRLTELVSQQGLPVETGIALWRIKAEFLRRRMEITAASGTSVAQRRAAQTTLVQQIEVRLIGVLGTGLVQLQRDQALQWLPKR